MKRLCVLTLLFVAGCNPEADAQQKKLRDAIVETDVVKDEEDIKNTSIQKTHEKIRAQNKEVIKLSEQLLVPINMTRKAERLGELKKVAELQKAFATASVSIHTLDELTLKLDRELKYAATTYRGAAIGYRERAEDIKDPKFKATCLSWALYYDDLEKRCPVHQTRLKELRAEIPKVVELVRESGKLLDGYEHFIATYESEILPDKLSKPYIEAIQSYAKNFEDFEKALTAYKK